MKSVSKCLVSACGAVVLATAFCSMAAAPAFAAAPVLGNDSYPYCEHMEKSDVAKLVVDASGGSSYAWYSSADEKGTYSAVEGAAGTLASGD